MLGESWIECLEQRSENEYDLTDYQEWCRYAMKHLGDFVALIANDLDNKWSMSHITSKLVITYSFKRYFIHLGVTPKRKRILYTLLIVWNCACDCVI